MKLYLVRHGQSVANVSGMFAGWQDSPLTEQGKLDAQRAADKLRGKTFSRCYTSELSRAYVTAQYCTRGRDIETIRTQKLNEQSWGTFENRNRAEILQSEPELASQLYADWTTGSPPEGEGLEDIIERVGPLVDEIVATGEDTLIVAHNHTLCAILVYLLGTNGGFANHINFEQGSYSMLFWDKKGFWQLRYFNI